MSFLLISFPQTMMHLWYLWKERGKDRNLGKRSCGVHETLRSLRQAVEEAGSKDHPFRGVLCQGNSSANGHPPCLLLAGGSPGRWRPQPEQWGRCKGAVSADCPLWPSSPQALLKGDVNRAPPQPSQFTPGVGHESISTHFQEICPTWFPRATFSKDKFSKERWIGQNTVLASAVSLRATTGAHTSLLRCQF